MWNDQALPSASVIVVPEGNSYTDPNPVATGTVDADGYFTISFNGTGNHTIWVMGTPDGYWGVGKKVEPDPGATVDLGNMYVAKKMTVLSPTDGFTYATLTPTYSWEAFPDAVDYRVTIWNTSTSPSTEIFQGSVGNVTEYTLDSALSPDTDYQFSVTAISAVKEPGSSAGIQFAYYSASDFTVFDGTTVTGRAMWNDQALPSVSVIAVPEGVSRYTTNPAATGSVEPDPGATVDLGNMYVAKKMTVPTIVYVLLPNGVDHRFEFSWEAFPDTVDYSVVIWNTSTSPSTEIFQGSVGNVTEYSFDSSLSLDTDYQFSVTAISAVKEEGSSAGIRFAYYSGLNFSFP
jgi:hypothetical protein